MNERRDDVSRKTVWLLIVAAYLFSFAIRLIWVHWASQYPSFFWNGQLMINTNDGYFFASGAQHTLWGLHANNPRVPSMWSYGVVALTTWLTKLTPMSLETVILYLPAIISSLVVIPIVLIARLFDKTLWGFLAALLGAVTWSYYNRTMVGYYDTDMFSAMAPMFILYFLMRSVVRFDLRSALYAALMIAIYPFLYDQGRAIVFAMGLIYAGYLIWKHKKERVTYESLILVFLALTPYKLPVPWEYLSHVVVVSAAYGFLQRYRTLSLQRLMIATGALFLLFLILGDVFPLIWHKIQSYVVTGTTEEGKLHFFAVNQTVREAGKIPFDLFARRISGSVPGFFLAMIGYGLLLWRYRPFLLSLPLMGIGFFAYWGGLRFTVYAVPVAALGAVYLFVWLARYIQDRRAALALPVLATIALLYPNIRHIIDYKVPTVFNASEVKDLADLNRKASGKDYTIAWWDYGYPIWFYADTSTLIDGGKHDEDNFIVSKVLQTDSPILAANFARLAVETYAKDPHHKVAPKLFEGKDPNRLLAEMEQRDFPLPPKTREVYFYLPYRMMNIFPTVMLFGNLDLTTGKALRRPLFSVMRPVGQKGNILELSGGVAIDLRRGLLLDRRQKIRLRRLVVTELGKKMSIRSVTQNYYSEGTYSVIFLKSYGRVVILDNQTFQSLYVQMFMLGRYDKELFELVLASPYTRIYRLKR
ncbi:STT3 domain-containing protein [Nitratifractor sp.]|uniref:STT3 domain-containing protein n=1 Tax=Nitratifractor sp. TaxID=2268144 RepID=UPI0025D4B34A|nr:STT3 domain-containing protein [Nitratifractor sp.]